MEAIQLRLATAQDAKAMLDIYSPYVGTPITFETEPPTLKQYTQRLEDALSGYPVLVATKKQAVVGFAYAHKLDEYAAYQWNAELSIYLAARQGRHGLGTVMYRALLDLLKLQGIRRAFGRVTLPNAASMRLHSKLKFKQTWVQKKAGWKNGRWHDVAWMEKQLIPQPEKGDDAPGAPMTFLAVDPEAVNDVLLKANAQLEKMATKPVVSATTRKCMQGNKGANTKPEQVVRTMLRDMGYPGYRLQWKAAPGRPDIAYPGRKLAIFVNGCFWHRCPVCNLPTPQSNVEYWEAKFKRNVERDAENRAALEEAGWTVVTLWEHDLKKDARPQTSRYLYEVMSLADEPSAAETTSSKADSKSGN